MSIELQTLANGDSSYVSKHNSNYGIIAGAVNGILESLGGASGGIVAVGPALAALLGPVAARINIGSLVASISGQTVPVTAGSAWKASASQVVTSAGGTVDLTGLSDDTYYIKVDSIGTPYYDTDSTDALWSVDKSGTSLSNLTELAKIVDGYKHPEQIKRFFPGVPGSSAIVLYEVITETVTLKSGLPGSYVKARTAATASTTFTIKQNGSSIGTFNFGAAATTATFTFSSDQTLVPGDELTIEAPGSADATLANIAMNLRGIR